MKLFDTMPDMEADKNYSWTSYTTFLNSFLLLTAGETKRTQDFQLSHVELDWKDQEITTTMSTPVFYENKLHSLR